MTEPMIISDVRSLTMRPAEQPAYDRPFDLRGLFVDARTGAEHHVVRYRAGTRGRWHRHSAAHTMIVLEGELVANGQRLGPGGYAHFPSQTSMLHEPGGAEGCTFVVIFDGPFDLDVVERQDG